MKVQGSNIALFPIDTTSRELEWQLVLASMLVREGWKCIIGHKQAIVKIHGKSKNCLWFGRLSSDTGRRESDFKILKAGEKNNTKFYYLHDEGGFFYDSVYEDTVKRLYPYNQELKRNISRLLMWGERQKISLLNASNLKESDLIVTGMPRFDLYKIDYNWLDSESIKALRYKFDEFTLITTKFGFANGTGHQWEDRFEKGIRESQKKNPSAALDDYIEIWSGQMHNFVEMTKMIITLAREHPDHNFVVRPHPSENKFFYEKTFAYEKNIYVIREGSVRKWIKASECVIHSSCTTGVEALLAGKSTINIKPNMPVNKDFDIVLARNAGISANNEAELLSIFQRMQTDNVLKSDGLKCQTEDYNILYNFNVNSFELILKLIQENTQSERSFASLPGYFENKYSRFKLDKVFKKKAIAGKESNRHSRLAPILRDDVLKVINGFNKHHSSNVKLEHHSPNYIVLS